jgi:aryl-alcohol dehydrogenase (NADP+)
MQFVPLGTTGTKVSRICLGCMTYGSRKWRPWVLEEEEGRPFLRKALDLGINFFDTADVYSIGVSEEILGRAMKDFGPPRDQLVIATKVHAPMSDDPNARGQSKKHIRHSIDNSLKRLRTDYVDLYQIHRFDPETPMEETIEALDGVVKAGKALYVGASSMYAWQFAELLHIADRRGAAKFVTMQNHYNLIYREEEREMNPFCKSKGIGLLPWSPLARGFLTGNRRKKEEGFGETNRAKTDDFAHSIYFQDSDFAVVDAVTQVAQARGISNAQVALAWLLHQPVVTAPIVGASKMHHLEDAIKAVDVKLSEEEMKLITEPYKPHPILGHS